MNNLELLKRICKYYEYHIEWMNDGNIRLFDGEYSEVFESVKDALGTWYLPMVETNEFLSKQEEAIEWTRKEIEYCKKLYVEEEITDDYSEIKRSASFV